MPVRPLSVLLSIPLLCALVACDREPANDAPAEVPAATAAAPAPASTADTVSAADGANASLPIASDAIAYFGFKTAPFGSDEKMLRAAWDGELTTKGPPQVDGCYYLYPTNASMAPGRYRIGFMMDGSAFRRIDVDDASLVAPGGGRIGMSTHEIAKLYAQRLEVQPHKYVDGANYLRVPDAGGSGQVLLFETDVEGRVTKWRIGQPPQVDYVEGCA
ncbi:lectin [Cognatilysobacter bugurensis]|uniref:Lectin n=1 Tax=Cognatilysobacter bugurensis TaxID=543356 RepID=A0A918T471_9GAMM|nr:lectin [Lysobacter bugurensis]GHA85996.1 hypothetical protein GCM10007067_25060 [Lysobacter bugurensis]